MINQSIREKHKSTSDDPKSKIKNPNCFGGQLPLLMGVPFSREAGRPNPSP
jgi:hypothetical protein